MALDLSVKHSGLGQGSEEKFLSKYAVTLTEVAVSRRIRIIKNTESLFCDKHCALYDFRSDSTRSVVIVFLMKTVK